MEFGKIFTKLNILPLVAAGLLLWMFNFPTADNVIIKLCAQLSCLLTLFLLWRIPESYLASWVQPFFKDEKIWTKAALFYFFAGASLIVIIFIILELNDPYFFTQQDNFDQFLPVILDGARGLFEGGLFPTWNGYQHLGMPTASLGYYALTYPVIYLCYGLARFICGNEFLTMELYVWLHLLLGYAISFAVMRYASMRPLLAASAAFCFVMLGYNIIVGRAWHYAAANVTWLPVMGLSLVTFMRQPPSLHWMLGTALATGLYFHACNIQNWCYGMMLWGLGVLWTIICKPNSFKSYAAPATIAVLIGLALIAPLLIVQKIETAGIGRYQVDTSIIEQLNSLLVPWGQKSLPSNLSLEHEVPTFYFFGGTFAFFFFIRFAFDIAALVKTKIKREQKITLCFSFIALLTLTLAIGSRGILWNWMARIQPFSSFRLPFKLLPFLAFFMILSGGTWLESALRKLKKHSDPIGLMIATIPIILIIITSKGYMVRPIPYSASDPYPELPAKERILQVTEFSTRGRIFPVYQFQNHMQDFPLTLSANHPTIYRIPVTDGFRQASLESELPETIKAGKIFLQNPWLFANEFGVEWVTISQLPDFLTVNNQSLINYLRSLKFREIDLGVVKTFDIRTEQTKPMAYIESSSPVALPYRIRTDGVDIKTLTSLKGEKHILIVNFLYRQWFKAFTDKKQELTVHPDAFGRIAIDIPPDIGMVFVRYAPPWHYGFYAGILLLLIAGLLWKFVWEGNKP
jgi:hypothetical protein